MSRAVYVDVDGVLTVPLEHGLVADFVRDEANAKYVGPDCWPTAKQSWEQLFLGRAPEALDVLRLFSDARVNIIIVTALPPWAAAEVMHRIGFGGSYSILCWWKAHASKLMAILHHVSVSRPQAWAWIDDKPCVEDLAVCQTDVGQGIRLFRPNPEEGITLHQATHVLEHLTLLP